MKIGSRLTLTLLFALSCLMGIALYLSYSNLKSRNLTVLQRQLDGLSRMQLQQLNEHRQQWEGIAKGMAEPGMVKAYVRKRDQLLEHLWRSELFAHPELIMSIELWDEQGKTLLLVKGEEYFALEPADRSALIRSLPPVMEGTSAGKLGFSRPYYHHQGESLSADWIHPIQLKQGRHYVLMRFRKQALEDLFKGFMLSGLVRSVRLTEASGGILLSIPKATDWEVPSLDLSNQGSQDHIIHYDRERERLVAFGRVPGLELEFWAVTIDAVVVANFFEVFRSLYIILFLAGTMATALTLFVTLRLVVRPLEMLKNAVEQAEEQWIELPDDLLKKRDETGAIAHSFDRMQQVIWEKIEDLSRLNEQGEALMRITEPKMLLEETLRYLFKRFEAKCVALFRQEELEWNKELVYPEAEWQTLPECLREPEFWINSPELVMHPLPETPIVRYPQGVRSILGVRLRGTGEETALILCYLEETYDELMESDQNYAESLARMTQLLYQNLSYLERAKKHNLRLEEEVENRTRELAELNRGLERRVHREVTYRLEQEALLVQQSKMADMGEMIGLIAHQWRQPLGSLGNMLANLKVKLEMGRATPEELGILLAQMNEQVQFLGQTVVDFRHFLSPHKKKSLATLGDSVRNAVKIIGRVLADLHVELIMELELERQIETFPNEVTQVVISLVKNALDALGTAKPEHPWIRLKGFSDKDEEVLQIMDNAGGIPEEVLPNIFEPNYTTKAEGTGLGLYMSRMIIEGNCQGRIHAGNHREGALFELRLPLVLRREEGG